MATPHSISGRPLEGEFAPYAKTDIDRVAGDDAVEALAAQERSTLDLFAPLEETKVRGLTYGPGKWTLKEVLGHLADDERIFSYRGLCIARMDSLPLPGFDEKAYVRFAAFEDRALEDVLDEYRAVRRASIALSAV